MTIQHDNLLIEAFHKLPQNECGTPQLTATGRAALTIAVRDICTAATRLEDLVDAQFIRKLIGVTANSAGTAQTMDSHIEMATKRLTPIPAPTFASWIVQYRTSGDRHWSTCSEHLTYEDAYRDLPARPRAGGEYRVLGVTA